jgi:hypothetical protein
VKACSKCKETKPLDEFHKQPSGKNGRHSYCKPCANEKQRESRVRNYSSEQKRRWQMKTRYGLTPDAYEAKLAAQNGVCEICKRAMKRPCVDHDHDTGAMRGILCHRCNLRLSGWEEKQWHAAAMQYLERHK